MQTGFSFEEIGLTTRDRRIYEALLSSSDSSIRSVASETGINRGTVHESIKKLIETGLVSYVETGKQHRYAASDPKAILELLQERQERARSAEEAAVLYIRSLKKTQQTEDAVPFATYYEEHEGVAAILRDVIATCKGNPGQVYRVISTKRVRDFMYQNFRNFTNRRIAENIPVKVIAIGEGGAKDNLAERKWLPEKRDDNPSCYTIIYGKKTAFISISETNVLSGIVIENDGVTAMQKEVFDHLWGSL